MTFPTWSFKAKNIFTCLYGLTWFLTYNRRPYESTKLTYLLPLPILMHSRQFDTTDISIFTITFWSKRSSFSTTTLTFSSVVCIHIMHAASVPISWKYRKHSFLVPVAVSQSALLSCGNAKNKGLNPLSVHVDLKGQLLGWKTFTWSKYNLNTSLLPEMNREIGQLGCICAVADCSISLSQPLTTCISKPPDGVCHFELGQSSVVIIA